MAVTAKKIQELNQRMKVLGLHDKDLSESFVRGSGRGGQKINKTNNCVYLIHEPSGIVVRCHREREREINRYLARRALCDELEFMQTGTRPEHKRSGASRSSNRNITITQRKKDAAPQEEIALPLPDISAFADIYHLDSDGNQLDDKN